MIVTVDGPAGAGKSTVSRALAARLGYRYLDTGAMYRAVTLQLLLHGGEPGPVARFGAWRALLGDPRLRGAEVSERVSAIACRPEVRTALRDAQRDFLRDGDAVAEGRDIGEVVWPQAELKVWLDADPALRAARRSAAGDGGEDAGAAALERDRRDAAQTVRPADSVLVDTSALDVEDVVERIVGLVAARAERRDPSGV